MQLKFWVVPQDPYGPFVRLTPDVMLDGTSEAFCKALLCSLASTLLLLSVPSSCLTQLFHSLYHPSSRPSVLFQNPAFQRCVWLLIGAKMLMGELGNIHI